MIALAQQSMYTLRQRWWGGADWGLTRPKPVPKDLDPDGVGYLRLTTRRKEGQGLTPALLSGGNGPGGVNYHKNMGVKPIFKLQVHLLKYNLIVAGVFYVQGQSEMCVI